MKKSELTKSEVRDLVLESLDIFTNIQKIEFFDSMIQFFGFSSNSKCLQYMVDCYMETGYNKKELLELLIKDNKKVLESNFNWELLD